MSSSFEQQRRRQALWAFIAAYSLVLVAMFVLTVIKLHQDGSGIFSP
jgi:type VI protein secretion system component VasF